MGPFSDMRNVLIKNGSGYEAVLRKIGVTNNFFIRVVNKMLLRRLRNRIRPGLIMRRDLEKAMV